jgi:putative membrane protein insertion efficiency factor
LNPVQAILVVSIQLYRWTLSPLKSAILGPHARCRFTPSCSAYALEAVRQHGAVRGAWLALRRVGRCHPWGGYGEDPVPRPGAAVQNSRESVCAKAAHGQQTAHSNATTLPVAPVIH